jgi:hypothetical protein
MRHTKQFIALIVLLTLLPATRLVQELAKQNKQGVTTQATGNPVTGSGVTGQLSRWTGVDGSNSFPLGNSIFFEDKFGKLGIRP